MGRRIALLPALLLFLLAGPVLSFFSQQSESALRDYFIQQLGQPGMTQQHYGREHLYFTVSGNRVRILISSRDDWRQVDIMVQNWAGSRFRV